MKDLLELKTKVNNDEITVSSIHCFNLTRQFIEDYETALVTNKKTFVLRKHDTKEEAVQFHNQLCDLLR